MIHAPRPAPHAAATRWLAGLVLLTGGMGGCAKSNSPAEAPLAAKSAEGETESEAPLADAAPLVEPAPTVPQLPPAEPQTEARSPRFERLVIFTPQGPLIIQLQISIQDRPQHELAEELLSEAAQAAGGSEHGEATWPKLVANSRFASGEFGNRPWGDAAARKKAIEEFDTNRNQLVERAELAACLSQNNAYGYPFSVDSMGTLQGSRRQGSPTFLLLDADQDGQLSAAELAQAAVRLHSQDVDGDDAIVVTELRAPPAMGQMPSRRRENERQAIELSKLESDSIYYRMRELYDDGDGLDRSAFALTPALFARLDRDQNGTITRTELVEMREARGDLRLKVNFAGKSPADQSPLELEELSQDLVEVKVTARVVQGRLRVEGEAFAMDVLVEDAAPDQPRNYRSIQVQARVGELPDPLFGWLDASHDGRLSAREMLAARERLSQLDRDGDGAISVAEVPEHLACIIARGAARQTSAAMEIAGLPGSTVADAPKWFAAMDQNSDGDISPLEFLGTAEQFSIMDLNGDGFLDVDEARQQAESAAAVRRPPSVAP